MATGQGAGWFQRDQRLVACAVEAGHPVAEDLNSGAGEGVGWHEYTVLNGVRQSAADAYLTPVLHRSNLDVITGADARRLVLNGGRCRGVDYTVDGELCSATAEREVVLTAGTIGSAQLLLLSGVGPGAQLREAGIDVVADVPGVGENLHERPQAGVAYRASATVQAAQFARRPQVRLRSDPAGPVDLPAGAGDRGGEGALGVARPRARAGPAAQDDAALRDAVRQTMGTLFHAVGSPSPNERSRSSPDSSLSPDHRRRSQPYGRAEVPSGAGPARAVRAAVAGVLCAEGKDHGGDR